MSFDSENFDALPPGASVSEQAGGVDLKKARRRRNPKDPMPEHRLPPHSIEAEQGCLGCVLLAPQTTLPEAIATLKTNVEIFYDIRHQKIYAAMIEMFTRQEEIDVITLQQWLADDQQLDAIGGIPYLNFVQDTVPSAANFQYYAEIVREKYLVRRAIQICTDTVASGYEFNGDVHEWLDQAEASILAIRSSMTNSQTVGILQVMQSTIAKVEALSARNGELTGLATGFADLDALTCGLQPGDMVVIAGRPSMGKTSLAMNIAEHAAIQNKIPVGIFSLEMTADALGMRLVGSQARVNIRNVREGFIAEADYPKLTGAAGKISRSPIHIDATPGLSIMELRARARCMFNQFGIKLFVVDYLQLLHSTSRRAESNRQFEIAEISGGIKELAKQLNVPIMVLSQLNREIEKQKRVPGLSDLRESGAIEQDADLVGLLYKAANDEEDDTGETSDGIPINLRIAKQRNGPIGTIHLTFLKSFTRFESAAKVSDDDVPADQPSRPYKPQTADP